MQHKPRLSLPFDAEASSKVSVKTALFLHFDQPWTTAQLEGGGGGQQ